MKIILDQSDIIELIKTTYEGVKEVVMKDVEITVNVDSKGFIKKETVKTEDIKPIKKAPYSPPIAPVPKNLTEEEKTMEEKKKGVMGAEGRRVISRVF